MRMTFVLMQRQDLADVDRIQHDAYPEDFVEAVAVFADKLHRYPQGCWISVVDGISVGYMFSHPGRLTSPPGLNKMLEDSDRTAKPDCYFIHDVAVLRSHRGMGVARGLVAEAFRVATTSGQRIVALVSVQGSSGYWRQQGFTPFQESQAAVDYVKQSYGDAACYMVQRIP